MGKSSGCRSRFLDFSAGLILHHYSVLRDFVFFLYNRIMGTESFVFENFLLHCITARHVGGAASLFPGALEDEGRTTLLLQLKFSLFRWVSRNFVYETLARCPFYFYLPTVFVFKLRRVTARERKEHKKISRVVGDVSLSLRAGSLWKEKLTTNGRKCTRILRTEKRAKYLNGNSCSLVSIRG